MEQRDSSVLVFPCQSSSAECAYGAPGKDGVGLVATVERNLLMQRCKIVCFYLLDRCPSPGTGDDALSAHEVLRDDRFAWGHPRSVSVE